MKQMSRLLIAALAGVISCAADLKSMPFQCTAGGERCMVPFFYQGVEYNQCAISGSIFWCPTGIDPTGRYYVEACTVCEAPPMCYVRADDIQMSVWKVSCPADCTNITSRLWTSTRNPSRAFYSMDSFVCTAAIQDGKIKGGFGGDVVVKRADSTLHEVSNIDIKRSADVGPKMAPLFSIEKTTINAPPMLFANVKGIGIVHKGNVQTVIDKLENVVSLALDTKKQILYWGDVMDKKIYRANASSSSDPAQALSQLQVKTPDGIAIDWVHGLFYWTDAGLHTVSVSTDLGEHPLTLIRRTTAYLPRAIALDPHRGFMYVSDWGGNAKIEQCFMDGENCQTIVGHDIVWPNGLAIDIENDLIYWGDAQLHKISVATTKGLFRRELVASAVLVKHPYSIVLHSDRLYWTDWHRGIVSVNKETGGDVHLHHVTSQKLMGLVVYDKRLQPEYSSHCRYSSCKFLCIPVPHGPRCVCPDGFVPRGKDDCARSTSSSQNNLLPGLLTNLDETYDAKDAFEEEYKHKNEGKGEL